MAAATTSTPAEISGALHEVAGQLGDLCELDMDLRIGLKRLLADVERLAESHDEPESEFQFHMLADALRAIDERTIEGNYPRALEQSGALLPIWELVFERDRARRDARGARSLIEDGPRESDA